MTRRALAAATVPVVIVGLAAVLRFWALDQGMPFLMARPDERETLLRTVGFPTGDLNPHWFVYPNLFFWTFWAWDEALLAIRRLWTATPDYAALVRSDMARLIVDGRALSALAGTATVALVYRLGRRVGGPFVGVLAALVLATNVLHVRDSHALKSESLLALGTLAAIAAVASFARRKTVASAVLAGGLIGLTTAIKYTGILLLFPAWLADVRTRAAARLVPSRPLLVVGGVTIGVFLLGSPFLVLDAPHVLEEMRLYRRAVFDQAPLAQAGLVRTRAFAYHLTVSLRRGCGLAMAIAAPLAVAAGLFAAEPLVWLAAAYVICHYVVIGFSPVLLARYFTPIVPLLALLVAWAIWTATARLRPGAGRAFARAALVVALVLEPTYASIAYDHVASQTDTRVLATRWMTEHVPRGAIVARFGSFIYPIADPDLPPQARLADMAWGDTDLDARGVTHVVTHQHILPFSQIVPQQWAAIAPRLRLLAEFSPWRNRRGGGFEREDGYYVPLWDFAAVVRPGPLVRVWAVEPAS